MPRQTACCNWLKAAQKQARLVVYTEINIAPDLIGDAFKGAAASVTEVL
ncbi:MAG: hypothetical protein OES99_02080 [Gammaproteobacteria bacterium]|nr:hypothetical protein [Gammaproteobacteria bacterium]